jgi:hypothetical protein
MKIASMLVVFLLSLIPRLTTAQTTWNGLRFGMSIKEAQDVMAAKGTSMAASDPQTLKSSGDYDLQFSGTAYPFPLTIELRFDSAGLSMIVLRLDVQEYRKRKPELSDQFAVWLFGSASYNALMEKYGKPVTQESDCHPLPSSPSWTTGCSADWRTDGQLIGFVVGPSQNTVLIQYRPQATQL